MVFSNADHHWIESNDDSTRFRFVYLFLFVVVCLANRIQSNSWHVILWIEFSNWLWMNLKLSKFKFFFYIKNLLDKRDDLRFDDDDKKQYSCSIDDRSIDWNDKFCFLNKTVSQKTQKQIWKFFLFWHLIRARQTTVNNERRRLKERLSIFINFFSWNSGKI